MRLNMKNVISSASFLFGLMVLLALISVFFHPKDNKDRYGMEDTRANGILSEPEDTLDVLFIGDSISYVSIVPMQIWRDYGITSYLCGTTHQKLYYTKEFLNKALEKQSPEIVFLGTATIFNNFPEKEKVGSAWEQMFPVLRYHDRWKTLGDWQEWKEGFDIEFTYQNESKGYYYVTGIDGIDASGYVYETNERDWIPEPNKETFLEIKRICDKNGAQLILLSEPNAAGSWTPLRHNVVADLAAEIGLEYIDINYMPEEVPIDWMTDTFDKGDHLNYNGSQKVTAYVGKYLAELGRFEDKRENPEYAFWNEQMEKFYEGKTE